MRYNCLILFIVHTAVKSTLNAQRNTACRPSVMLVQTYFLLYVMHLLFEFWKSHTFLLTDCLIAIKRLMFLCISLFINILIKNKNYSLITSIIRFLAYLPGAGSMLLRHLREGTFPSVYCSDHCCQFVHQDPSFF